MEPPENITVPAAGFVPLPQMLSGLVRAYPSGVAAIISGEMLAQTKKTYYICTPIRGVAASQVEMVDVAQSVRVTDCGSEGRGFESHLPPQGSPKGALFRCIPLGGRNVF